MNIKTKLLSFLLLSTSALTFTLFSCSSPTDPGLLPSLTIAVDGVTSTEAFIKLSTNNISLPASVSLSRNSKQINSFTLITTDTTIVDNNLNPNQSYTYSAELTDANNQKAVSTSVLVQTMDTTSHNFTWQTYTFGGQGGSSTLYDVAIINENDIWAVGEMYVYDSTGSPVLYNAVHYDGGKWELKRIKTEFRGNIITIELEGIFAFSPTDIWMVGSLPIHGDGQNWTMFDVRTTTDPNLSLSKAWGANTNDMYFVGRGGSIAHYQNGSWQKINSGTDKRLTDIYGTLDRKNIWVCGWDNNHTQGIILNIDNTATNIIWDGIVNNGEYNGFINTLWSDGSEFWLAGGLVFRQSTLFTDKGHLVRIPTENGSRLFDPGNFGLSIRGSAKNNIFLAGDLGMLWHYNGKSWHKYFEFYSSTLDRRIFGIAVKDNLIVAVGWKDSNAWIILGKK